MNSPDIARSLKSLTSVQEVEQLKKLEALVKELNDLVLTPELYQAIFDLYEKFPEDDGYGLFTSILHRLERCSGYEQFLIQSMKRKPTYIAIRMIDRIVVGGFTQIGEVNLLSLVRAAAKNSLASESARVYAQQCVQEWSASDADA